MSKSDKSFMAQFGHLVAISILSVLDTLLVGWVLAKIWNMNFSSVYTLNTCQGVGLSIFVSLITLDLTLGKDKSDLDETMRAYIKILIRPMVALLALVATYAYHFMLS